MFSAPRTAATSFGAGTPVEGEPGGMADNITPQLSRDGSTLLFASDQFDGNAHDLYTLTRSCQ